MNNYHVVIYVFQNFKHISAYCVNKSRSQNWIILWQLIKEPESEHTKVINQGARIEAYCGDKSRSQNWIILWRVIEEEELEHIVATSQGAIIKEYCGK